MRNRKDEIIRVISVWLLFIVVLLSSGVLLQSRLRDMINTYILDQVSVQADLTAEVASDELFKEIDNLSYISRFIENQKVAGKHSLDAVAMTDEHESMGILALNGKAISGESLSAADYPGIQEAFRGNRNISYSEGKGMIFTCPVYDEKNVKYVIYKLYDDVAMNRNINISSSDNRKVVITTRDGTVIMSFSDVTRSELSNFESEAFKAVYQDLSGRMDLSSAVSGFSSIDNEDYAFFTAEIPNTSFRIEGYMPAENVTGGLSKVSYLIVFVYGFMLVLFAIGTLYLIITAEKANESEELRKAKKIAEEANKAKSSFLASMSHEIRTPINAVLGMDEMIIRETDNEHILEYASNINNAGKTLLNLINDILDFSKIEAGKMEIIPKDYKTGFMISDLVSMIAVRAHNKGIKFEVKADPSLPSVLNGDEERVMQCILNILTNAVKYTERGTVTFNLTGERISQHEIMLNVSVSDTGIGIRESDLERLFSPFERVDEERNKSIEGTGLGLSIVKNLLYLMDTSLQVESTYGKGSRFYFDIKQGVADWSPMGDFAEEYKKAISSQSKYKELFRAPNARVLVVDDTEMNLTVFKGLLKKTKIKIDSCTSGFEAIEMVKKREYDILFIDHRMPKMDGVETLEILNEMEDNLSLGVPCIAFTANAGTGSRELYRSYGFNDYLSKPVSPTELEEMILKYLPAEKIAILAEGEEDNDNEEDRADDEAFEEAYQDAENLIYNVAIAGCGSKELLRETATLFYKTIDERASEIEKYYIQEDLENFTVKVHALKSSARLVGAVWLSQKAEYLERCGNERNIDEIRLKAPELLKDYRELKNSMAEIFKNFGRNLSEMENSELPNDLKERMNKEMFDNYISDIRASVEIFDFDSIKDTITLMNEYRQSDERKRILDKIYDAADMMDDEKIVELLGEVE